MIAGLFAIWFTIVIDQMDGNTALVEWGPNVFGTLPTDVLPDDTHEGDHVQVRIRPRDLHIADAQHGAVLFSASVLRSRPLSQTPRADSPPNHRRRP